jgi:AraC family transcriptional regulator
MLQEFDLDSKKAVLRYESISEDQFILQIARLVQSELDHETSSGRLFVESLGNTLALYLTRTYSEAAVPSNKPRSDKPLDVRRLSRVQDFIASNIGTDFGIDDLAKVACLSPAHFSRCFKKATGYTPHEFVSRMRLDVAKKMLLNDVQPISEIAFASGFSSQADFSRAFRRATNMTPKQYRERER